MTRVVAIYIYKAKSFTLDINANQNKAKRTIRVFILREKQCRVISLRTVSTKQTFTTWTSTSSSMLVTVERDGPSVRSSKGPILTTPMAILAKLCRNWWTTNRSNNNHRAEDSHQVSVWFLLLWVFFTFLLHVCTRMLDNLESTFPNLLVYELTPF